VRLEQAKTQPHRAVQARKDFDDSDAVFLILFR